MTSVRDKFGLCQWFHYEDHRAVERTVEMLHDLGVHHLRTGISWADWHRPRGRRWYRWQMEQLADFDVLLSIWHTPPSISENHSTSGPPRRLQDYADFIWTVTQEYGGSFSHLELWNEPNNRLKWAFPTCDPQWQKFGAMIGMAARTARDQGVSTVLGGMVPIDPAWLNLMQQHGALDDIDIIAIHGFPQMWWNDFPNWDWYRDWHGWDEKFEKISPGAAGRPVWITETGLATWDLVQGREDRFVLQMEMVDAAIAAPTDRVYWYCAIDLSPDREAIEGFHVDENEYHLGLMRYDGTRKPAYDHVKARLRDHEAR